MPIKRKPFFYDRQVARYLAQIMGVFAGYQVMTGLQRDGKPRFIDVPVIYGDSSRVAAWVMNKGNDNSMVPLPVMAVDMVSLKRNDNLRRNPEHFEVVRHRKTETESDTIERHMPVPYDLGIRLAIWSSNTDQGLQLVEQLGAVFNGEIKINLSNSPFDWVFTTFLRAEAEFSIGKASAGIGEGGEEKQTIFSIDFTTVIHLSAPAKVYSHSAIDEVHVNLLEMNDPLDFDSMDLIDNFVITAAD
jgi:hypothetical protein